MAMRKKAKGKTRAKRKKGAVTKAASRRKKATVRKKPTKKAPPRRPSPKRAPARRAPTSAAAVTPPPARPVAAKQRPTVPAQPAPPEERIGVVTHYYSDLAVAILRLDSGTLRVGDVIHIRGHTTDFGQEVESLEVNHAPVTEVEPNVDFGLKVVGHAREHDVVYKVRQ